MNLEGLAGADAELGQIELEPAAVLVSRVHVHDDEDDAREVLRALAVGHQRLAAGLVESDASRLLERRLLAARPVHERDGVAQRARLVEAPGPQLELLVVEVVLGAGTRDVLHQLERRPVDAPVARERRGEHEPREERRLPAVLEMLGQDVRRVRPEARPVDVGDRAAR